MSLFWPLYPREGLRVTTATVAISPRSVTGWRCLHYRSLFTRYHLHLLVPSRRNRLIPPKHSHFDSYDWYVSVSDRSTNDWTCKHLLFIAIILTYMYMYSLRDSVIILEVYIINKVFRLFQPVYWNCLRIHRFYTNKQIVSVTKPVESSFVYVSFIMEHLFVLWRGYIYGCNTYTPARTLAYTHTYTFI